MGILGDLIAGTGYSERLSGNEKVYPIAQSAVTADQEVVTKETALKVSSWFAAHRILCTQFMKAPLKLYKRTKDGGREEIDSPLSRTLRLKPNHIQNALAFKQLMLSNAFWGGGGFAHISVNIDGSPVLTPLNPARVEPRLPVDSDELYYVYTDEKGRKKVYFKDEMLHFPGIITMDGVSGIPLITYAATQIGIVDKQYKHTAFQLKNRGLPVGKFKSKDPLSVEQRQEIRAEYQNLIAGPENNGKVMVVTGDSDFEPIQMTNEQMQFLADKRFSIQDTSRFTGVPPVMLFDNSESTWNNNPEQNRFFLEYGLDPWLVAFEMVCNTQLLSTKDQLKYFFEFDRSAYFQMDLEKTSKALLDGKYGGWINADEARAKFNMPPMPDGLGKVYWRPENMAPADAEYKPDQAAKNDPKNASEPPQKEQKIAKNEAEKPKKALIEPLLTATFSRVMTKLENEWQKYRKRENSESSWSAYRLEKKSLFVEDLQPVLIAVSQHLEKDTEALKIFARNFAEDLVSSAFAQAVSPSLSGPVDYLLNQVYSKIEVSNE